MMNSSRRATGKLPRCLVERSSLVIEDSFALLRLVTLADKAPLNVNELKIELR
jgi:hypothetical protein